ncbi:heme-binding protein [Actinoplanes philippinensis]|uniref:heme-binding protein n=1 Tax=Actinoplanes philippinensis TaxID=35752 RepID=UPI0033DB0467
MTSAANIERLEREGRHLEPARTGDPDLGPFALLPGTWANKPNLPGRGWNMIALPFAPADGQGGPPFRLLVNQYNEELKFQLVDKAVPNRGVDLAGPKNTDQKIVAIDYEQAIAQIVADDFPQSGLAGPPDLAIHHEPGLLLNLLDQVDIGGPRIARLATIPHGDSVLALGDFRTDPGAPNIPAVNSLPIGVSQDLNNPYLAAYKHFHDNPFQNLFDPTDPTALLKAANQGVNIRQTTVLEFDSTVERAGISNIPFVVKQANASEMKATFFLQEIEEADGSVRLRLQYVQVVQLDFFPRGDGGPGRIKWPHVSINTMEKVSDHVDTGSYARMPG